MDMEKGIKNTSTDKNIVYFQVLNFFNLEKKEEDVLSVVININGTSYYFERSDVNLGEGIYNKETLSRLMFLDVNNDVYFKNDSEKIVFYKNSYDEISKELFRLIDSEIGINNEIYFIGDYKSPFEITIFKELLLYNWSKKLKDKINFDIELEGFKDKYIHFDSILFTIENLVSIKNKSMKDDIIDIENKIFELDKDKPIVVHLHNMMNLIKKIFMNLQF